MSNDTQAWFVPEYTLAADLLALLVIDAGVGNACFRVSTCVLRTYIYLAPVEATAVLLEE